ncbi:MAG TPA: aminoacyl-tRNA hydrolase [Acidobacteriota bacterium]
MKALIGLGNPEGRYAGNRHNIGFMILDRLAKTLGFALTETTELGWYQRLPMWGVDTVVFKPCTYMNNSGLAVRSVLERWQIEPADLLVVYDDLALPLGKIRIRATGGSAGHNGINSIILALGSNGFPRLRFGIGPCTTPSAADFVLSDFMPEERAVVERELDRAVSAIRSVWGEGLPKAMSVFNREPDET